MIGGEDYMEDNLTHIFKHTKYYLEHPLRSPMALENKEEETGSKNSKEDLKIQK